MRYALVVHVETRQAATPLPPLDLAEHIRAILGVPEVLIEEAHLFPLDSTEPPGAHTGRGS
jgi:hypothetical protein